MSGMRRAAVALATGGLLACGVLSAGAWGVLPARGLAQAGGAVGLEAGAGAGAEAGVEVKGAGDGLVPIGLAEARSVVAAAGRAYGEVGPGGADEALRMLDRVARSPADGDELGEDELLVFRRVQAIAAYNAGVLRLERGEDGLAAELMRIADRFAGDATLASRARTNLGFALLGSAGRALLGGEPAPTGGSQQQPASPAALLASLRAGAAAFRSVLEVLPGDREAMRRVEVTRRAIREIEAAMERQREQQRQRQEQQDELSRAADEQEREAEENEQGEQSDEQQSQDQQRLSEQTQESLERAREMAQEQRQDAESRSRAETSAEMIERARREQASAEEALGQGDRGRAAEHQRRAAEALREAAEQLQQSAQPGEQRVEGDAEGEKNEQQQEPADGQPEGEDEGGEATDELVERLLDRERLEREYRRRMQRPTRRATPVERDW